MKEVFDELLKHSWNEEEKNIIVRMIANMNTYRYLISSTMKKDIIDMMELAIKVKIELELLRSKFKIIENEIHETLI